MKPEFELVALHGRHFLPPPGNKLSIFDRAAGIFREYIPASDFSLREATTNERLPTFVPPTRQEHTMDAVNVFLVAINAQMKFKQFKAMYQEQPLPLPSDHVVLVERTLELVDLFDWKFKKPKASRSRINLDDCPDDDADIETRRAYWSAMMSGHGAFLRSKQPFSTSPQLLMCGLAILDCDYENNIPVEAIDFC